MSDSSFNFEVDRVKTHFSKAEIIASLKEYGKISNSVTFGMREYDNWKDRIVSSETIGRIFGTWGKAQQQAGFRAVRGQKVDPKAMIEAFKQCWVEHSSVPSLKQLAKFLDENKYPFRVKTYGLYFGGVGALAQRISDFQAGKLSENELLQRQARKTSVRQPISVKLRYAILKRDGEQCVKCGASPKKNAMVTLEVDHIVSVADGGTNEEGNLQTLCWSCNSGKSDRPN